MKPRLHRTLPQAFVICFAPLLACTSASASVVATNESQSPNSWTLPTGTNLLAGATVTTSVPLGNHGEGTSTDPSILTNGGFGIADGNDHGESVSPANGTSMTYALDLSGHPTGYNVTSFDSYCAWDNSGRDNQNYMLQYSTVGNPGTFITISTVNLGTGGDRSTHTQLTDNTGFLATGVHSIRVIFDRQENGYVGYREFVLRDTSPLVSVDNAAKDDNSWPPLVGPNLLNGATATPAPTQPVHGGDIASDTWTTVTDGVLGTVDTPGNAQSVTPNNNDTVTFPLDLAAKPGGYDITSFESYCAWGSNGRDDQRYTLEYSTATAPGIFLPITEVFNHTEFNGPNNRKSTRTRVTGNGGKLALGVGAIRITFHDQENGYTGFREFILRDTPLPTSIVRESNATNIWTLPTGTNLLSNTLEKTPAFAEGNNHGNNDVTSSDWTVLTDGSVGSAGVQLQSVGPLNNTSVIFPLDISTNTKGYNLTSLDTYAAWGDSGRDDQDYTVSYSTATAPGVFIPIETVSNKTFAPNNSTHTRIAANSGFLAANVGAVKFDFANQENGWVGLREFIALGSAAPLANPLTWTGLTGSSWVTTADNNWKEGSVSTPFSSLAPLTFDTSGINIGINIPTALTANSLTFTNDISKPYTFSGQLLTVTNGVALAGSGTVAFANSVQAAGLAVSGTGSLTLSAANALTGSSTVSNGTLNVVGDLSLGTSSLTLTGGTVKFTSTDPEVRSISGTGGAILLGNPVGSVLTELVVGDTTTTIYAGSIANAAPGTGSLTKIGTGTLTLTGTNTYSGTTTVAEGELKLGKRVSLYGGISGSWSASNIIVFTDLTLQMGGVGEFTSADIAALPKGGFDDAAILGLDTTSGNAGISNVIGGSVKLVKEGINTLTLSGTNTFTRGITVTQGALALANPAGFSIPGDLTVGNVTFDSYVNMGRDNQFGPNALIKFNTGTGAVNGKVQLRGTSQTVAGLESGTNNRLAYIQNDDVLAPGYTTNPGLCTLTINTPQDAFSSFRGIIRNQDGDSLSLVKTGPGTQQLVNSEVESYSYNGTTSVNQGKLRFNFSGGNTGFGSNITIAPSATLEFHAEAGDHNFDREISGAGHVLVNGTYAVRFSNNNSSWSGGTTVGFVSDGTDETLYKGFLALVGNGAAGEGTALGQNCAGGAMIPSNLITVENGATLALDGIASLGNSNMLPQFAPSVRITENSTLYGGSVSFVPNITLDGGTIEITSGSDAGSFGTNLAFVGTLIVGGSSTAAAEIVYATNAAGPFANASLGSLGQPGTTFQVAQVGDNAVDLKVTTILRNVGGAVSPLTKTGPGTMSLEGANTYTGTTTVSGGELTVHGNSILNTNKLVIAGGKVGVVADETVGTLVLGGVQQLAGTYGSLSSGAANKSDTYFSGAGIVTVSAGPAVTYDAWAVARITNVNDRDRTDDPDTDGFTNLEEFLFGTSPVAANGSLATIENTGGGLVIHWNERINSSSVYVLQESVTLQNPWPTSGATITDSAVQGIPDYVRKEAIIPITTASKFVRVNATE